MKIKNVDKFPISLHFTKAGYREEDKASSVWARGVYPIIIRINTDEGISGLGVQLDEEILKPMIEKL